MDKTILDFTEATELANDDYIIFDSVSGGACRILAKKIAPVVLGVEAIYTQTQEVTVDTPLDDLRQDLVVEAIYQHNRRKVVTDYTLNGTLTVGTSTITVSFQGHTDTINVTVTGINYLYNWDFKQSLRDQVRGQVAVLSSSSASRTDNDGVILGTGGELKLFDNFFLGKKTLEIDFTEITKSNTGSGIALIRTNDFTGFLYSNSLWRAYKLQNYMSYETTSSTANFTNITMQFIFTSIDDNKLTVNVIDKTTGTTSLLYYGNTFALGSQYQAALRIVGGLGSVIVTGVRIYDNV